MFAEYSSQLYWAKYGIITAIFGVWIGLVGYKNISATPSADLLQTQEVREVKLPIRQSHDDKKESSVTAKK